MWVSGGGTVKLNGNAARIATLSSETQSDPGSEEISSRRPGVKLCFQKGKTKTTAREFRFSEEILLR